MGFEEGQIVLDSPNGAYYSGQAVSGQLNFTQEKPKTFRGIYVQIKGFCKVHWTTTHTETVNGKSRTYTKSHDSHEEYVNIKTYLVGGESGETTINPGTFEYNFRFTLPPDCPSSFEGSFGHVRYTIKAVVDRSLKFDQEKKVAVRVMAPLNLNIDPYCRNPLELEFHDSYCCFCMGSGSADTIVKLPVSGYCPGQTIPIELSCSNQGSVEIDYIKLEIIKKLTFTANYHPGTKKEKEVVAEIKKGSIPTNTSRNWTVDMMVPALDIYNLNRCRYIDVDYEFKVTVNPNGCHTSTDGSQRIVIGTIPLVGFQDNVQNPLEGQMPQQTITAVTQQPQPVTSPYPASPYPPVVNVSPYPNTVSPYPQTVSPYPPTASPYPNTTSSYPTGTVGSPYPNKSQYPAGNSPYPVGNSPHPAGNSPYPLGNSPHPAGNSPYPLGNSPHPAGNSPYPLGNSPHPAGTSPYPVGNTPYPAGNSPYPTGNSPYPPANLPYPSANPTSSPYPDNPPPYQANSPYPANPYPAANSPYSDGNAPYPRIPYPPESTRSTPKQDKPIGFNMQGGNSDAPQSPPNERPPAPYPSATSPNPYAAASAPALDSPEPQK